MFTGKLHECHDPSHKPYPHHHGALGAATNHRNPGCPWECGQDVYTKFAIVKNVDVPEPGTQVVMPVLSLTPLPDYDAFEADLEKLINHHSMENGSNTRDFVLARYLVNVLKAYDASRRNEEFYKKS